MKRGLGSGNLRGAALALLAFATFSIHDVLIKLLGGTYAPVQTLFFSVLFGFPLATLTLMSDRAPGTLLPVHPWWMAIRTLATVTTGICAFTAFSLLPLAQAYIILFASPLLITVLAIPLLGEKVRLHRWFAVLVGLSGVIVVLQPGSTVLQLGHFAALGAAAAGSLNAVVVRKIGSEERPVVMMLYPMVANFGLLGAALYWVYTPMPFEDLAILALISLLAFFAGRLIISAYQAGEAAIIAPMQYSQIIWASIYGALFFNESLDRATLIGAGLIILSGLYIVFRESRGSATSATPVLRTRSRPETGTYLRASPFLRFIGKHPETQKGVANPDKHG